MTLFSSHETDDFDETTTTAYLEGFREGSAYVGYDVDIETLYNFNIVTTPPSDMSVQHIGVWLRISNAGSVDLKVNGGMQIAVRDGSGNESYWYVGGIDTYSGGWSYFVAYCGNTPDANNGTVATLTDITNLGVGFKMLSKSMDDNCHIDAMYTGTSGLVVTGSPDTGTYGTDKSWNEVYDIQDAAAFGAMSRQSGSYVLNLPVTIGDNAGSLTTAFNDVDSILFFADLPVSQTFYGISVVGNATGTTDFRLGVKVGTGDSAVGSNGNIIKSANPSIPWKLDLSDSNITSANTYGTTFANMSSSTVANANVQMVSTIMDSSDQVIIGIADIYNSTISNSTDILGAILLPSGDTHAIRKTAFNNNSRAIEIDTFFAGGYTFNALSFSGNTFDVNNTSGSTQDVNKANGANPNTYTGTLVNFLATFTLTLTDLIAGSVMGLTIVNSSTRAELKYELLTTTSTTYSHSGGETVDILLNSLEYDPNLSDIYDLTLDNADQSIKFQILGDSNYDNP